MSSQPLKLLLQNLFSSAQKKTGTLLREFALPSDGKQGKNVTQAEFESHLGSIMSKHPVATTGRVQLINIGKISEHLGDAWEKKAKTAHMVVCAAIERRLSSEDIYSRYSDFGYVIVFANLDKKQAQLKSVLMAKEISEKILGHQNLDDFIDVSTMTTKSDGRVSFDQLPPIADLASDLETKGRQEEKPLETSGGAIRLPREDIKFIFRPIWFVRQHVISAFLCIPIREVGQGRHASGYSVLYDPNDPMQIFELDTNTVQKVSEELEKARQQGKKALFAVPVHFETLANINRRAMYFEQCRSQLKDAEKIIIFEVVGLPDGVPDSRVVDVLSPLKPLSRSVLARFSIEHRDFMGYHGAGIHAVGIDLYGSEDKEKPLMKAMEKFVVAANKSYLKTYVHGVRTLSLNTAAVSCGFDYIDGYVLTSPSESTEGAYFLEMEELYKP